MHIILFAILKYFSPIIFAASKIGPESTALIASQIETAANLIHLEKTLKRNFGFRDDSSLDPPSETDIKEFFERLVCKRIGCNKRQILESLYFYHQIAGTRGLSVEQIAAEALDDDTSPVAIYKNPSLLDDGRKSDRFGLLRMMNNTFHDSLKRSTNQIHLFNKEQLELLSVDKLNSIVDSFKSSEEFAADYDPDFDNFLKFLHKSSKYQLRKLGIDSDNFIFQHREEFASEVFETSFNRSSALLSKFVEYLNEKMSIEMIENEVKASRDLVEIAKDYNELMFTFLNIIPIDYGRINEILNEIDENVNSAAKSVIRINGFKHGSELGPYPKYLVREIILKDEYAYLEELASRNSDGIRGVYALDQEEIFIAAYDKETNESFDKRKWKWIKLLIRTGFEFSENQKKALFRDILRSEDCDLLDLMIGLKKLNLSEYQKDRGITFFHSLLIDGSEEILDHVYSNYVIEEPELKVQFIPNYSQDQLITCNYWHPHENNFKLELPNFALPGMKIRKNWDNLMIAAAAGRRNFMRSLMEKSVDTSGYDKIKHYLKEIIM